jgi:sugar/nucleoside kinase (ribokinase family)
MKVLGIGESVIDKASFINGAEMMKCVGGPTPIALILLSRLGVDCTLLTTLGKDEEGQIITEMLADERVQVVGKQQEQTKVNKYLINPKDGSRKKIRGTVIHEAIENIDEDFLAQFSLIIIDRHEKKAFYEILKKKKESTKILIDPSTEVSQFTLDMIKYADYPILPIEALTRIQGAKDIRECLERLYSLCRKTVIVTAGDLGSIIYDGLTLELIPALQIRAVDVQGAGDVYRGAFAYGILQEWDIKKCVQYANKIAALQCTRLGNSVAIPQKSEIDLFENITIPKKRISLPTIDNYFTEL